MCWNKESPVELAGTPYVVWARQGAARSPRPRKITYPAEAGGTGGKDPGGRGPRWK